jgi:DNA-binding HxlR family transcriptional regulator
MTFITSGDKMSENNRNTAATTATAINVSITIRDVRVEFNGSADSVLTSVISFISKQVPAIDLARKISLNYAATDLIEIYANLIKITPEGPRVIPDLDELGQKKISDKEMVALQLIASKISKDIGKIADDSMQASEIQSNASLNPKSVSSRLSELVKAGHVVRATTKDGIGSGTVAYRITTSGIHWLNSVLVKRIKQPLSSSSTPSSPL